MGPETGPDRPDEGRGAPDARDEGRAARSGRARRPVAPPGPDGPGAERAILIILILILICALLGVAAGIMVIVSRNTPGGGSSSLAPLLAVFTYTQ